MSAVLVLKVGVQASFVTQWDSHVALITHLQMNPFPLTANFPIIPKYTISYFLSANGPRNPPIITGIHESHVKVHITTPMIRTWLVIKIASIIIWCKMEATTRTNIWQLGLNTGMGKPTVPDKWVLQVRVWYPICHTCAKPCTCGVVSQVWAGILRAESGPPATYTSMPPNEQPSSMVHLDYQMQTLCLSCLSWWCQAYFWSHLWGDLWCLEDLLGESEHHSTWFSFCHLT